MSQMEYIGICNENLSVYFFNEERTLRIFNLNEYEKTTQKLLNKLTVFGSPIEYHLINMINKIAVNNFWGVINEENDCPNSMFSSININTGLLKGFLSFENLTSYIADRIQHIPNIELKYIETSPEGIINVGFEDLLSFKPTSMKNLIEKLKVDLIAFKFVERKMNENGRFELPIYINENSMKSLQFDAEEYYPHWASIKYIEMLKLIHEFFNKYYKLDEIESRELSYALIELLDYKFSEYPIGLKKSIEVGRATSGKAAFIEEPVEGIPVDDDLITALQAKDIFGFVPDLIY